MSESTKCNIILAIDPFEKRMAPSKTALRELHYWANRMNARVEAVYVMSESDQYPRFNQTYTRAYDLLNRAVQKLNLGVPVRIKVIWDHDDIIQDPAQTLIDYAEDTKADLILVSSHGRKWLTRMVLGSFAERLLVSAGVPILFFGSLPDATQSFGRVMFTTDFSEASKIAFKIFMHQIKPINPEVLIFHVAEYPNLVTGMSLTGVGAYLPETYWKVMKESLVAEGEQWVKFATEKGLRARAIIEEGLGDVSTSILKVARQEGVALIGLASIRSDFQKIVMGSVATRVFRSHKQSIWVLGRAAFEKVNRSHLRPDRTAPASPSSKVEKGPDL